LFALSGWRLIAFRFAVDNVERRGPREHIRRYLIGAITVGSPMIGPSLFRAQTVMWGRFDAYLLLNALITSSILRLSSSAKSTHDK